MTVEALGPSHVVLCSNGTGYMEYTSHWFLDTWFQLPALSPWSSNIKNAIIFKNTLHMSRVQ